jgi:hypothetical protein
MPPVESVAAASEQRDRSWFRDERVPPKVAWAVLAGVVLVALARSPYLLFEGRFWAEEGSLHFQHMFDNASPGDLFFVQTRTGYYNAFANLSTWLASLAPILYAPLVTAWLSLGVLAMVAGVALFWPSELLPVAGAKIAAGVLLVVGTLAEPEVWLNTINAQTYLAVLTLLLLFTPVAELSRRRFGVSVAMLVLAGFSGLYSIALTPLFLVRAITERTRRRWVQAVTLGVVAVVQVVVFLVSRSSGELAETKVSVPGASELVRTVGGWHIGAFLLGPARVDSLMQSLEDGSWLAAAALALIAFAVVALLGLLLWRAPNVRVPLLLLGAFVLIELLVQLGSLEQATGRYVVLPIAILTLAAIHGAATCAHPRVAMVGVGLCVVVLIAGLSSFWTRQPTLLRCEDCPEWRVQVRAWEAGGSGRIDIWPYDRGEWVVQLDRDEDDERARRDGDPAAATV